MPPGKSHLHARCERWLEPQTAIRKAYEKRHMRASHATSIRMHTDTTTGRVSPDSVKETRQSVSSSPSQSPMCRGPVYCELYRPATSSYRTIFLCLLCVRPFPFLGLSHSLLGSFTLTLSHSLTILLAFFFLLFNSFFLCVQFLLLKCTASLL